MSSHSTVETGRRAEVRAADWLRHQGFIILSRNWRTRWCELDIVAMRERTIHVIEVKYRRNHRAGSGFDYITPDKATRLRRATLAWLQVHHLLYRPCQLDVIAIWGYPQPKYLLYRPNAIQSD